jgi:hypothetical protein
MPKAFDSWKVFPHRPLEKLEPNLWRVEGDLPNGNGTRVMTIAKLADGRLVIHSCIALEEELMKEIEAFGTPAFLLVPNGFHRLDSKVYKERYPQLKVLCPTAEKKKVEQVVAVDGNYGEVPKDDGVRVFELEGTKGHEGVIEVHSPSGTSLVFNDSVNNVPKLGGLFGFMLSPTGRPSVPRIFRWFFVKDKSVFIAHVEKLAAIADLKRVIVSHGKMMDQKPADDLKMALSAF